MCSSTWACPSSSYLLSRKASTSSPPCCILGACGRAGMLGGEAEEMLCRSRRSKVANQDSMSDLLKMTNRARGSDLRMRFSNLIDKQTFTHTAHCYFIRDCDIPPTLHRRWLYYSARAKHSGIRRRCGSSRMAELINIAPATSIRSLSSHPSTHGSTDRRLRDDQRTLTSTMDFAPYPRRHMTGDKQLTLAAAKIAVGE